MLIMYANERLWKLGVITILIALINTFMGAMLTDVIPNSISIPIWVSGLVFFGVSGIICGIFKFKDYLMNRKPSNDKIVHPSSGEQ